ncbi:hypothetical protein RQP46_008511 [Phenoliferia psychrophenolica]
MVFISMPQVAPGTQDNPFPAFIEDLRNFAYGTPAPGLEVRIDILFGIAAAVFVKGKPQTSLGPIWIAFTGPIMFFGLLMSWGSACAYLITPDSHRSRFTRPRVVKIFFLGLGGGQCLAHFATLLFAAVYCPKVSKLYERAMVELNDLRLDWDSGTYTPERLESYRTTFNAMQTAYDRYQPVIAFSFGIIALTGGCIFFCELSADSADSHRQPVVRAERK